MDPRLDRIIDKAMQEDREKRYATAKEMRLEVEEAFSKPLSQAEASVHPGRKSPATPAARGNRGLWMVAAAIGAAAVGFVAVRADADAGGNAQGIGRVENGTRP